MLKITTERKTVKNNEAHKAFHGPLSKEWLNRRYWSPALRCHVDQSNEYYLTLIQGCIEIMSQHPVR